MKIKNLIWGALACATFCACSNDDIIEKTDKTPVFKGDKAYIAINIVNSNESTRGTGNTPPFYYGTEDENKVTRADFYFYDENGAFFRKGFGWDGGTANGTNSETDNNVEFIGKTVVVLDNLKETERPKYVIAVLNDATGVLLDGKSLNEAVNAISNIGEEGTDGSLSNFVMTSSTYLDGSTPTYWTELSEANFWEKDPGASTETGKQAVEIYVERLAAKVELAFKTGLLDTNNKATLGKYKVDGKEEDISFQITGWGLDATSKESYAIKNIENFSTLGSWSTWNDKNNYRSYWGKSTIYGKTDSFIPNDYGQTIADSKDIKSAALNYTKYNELKPFGSGAQIAYCAENTNTAEILKEHFNPGVTSVLIAAKIKVGDETKDIDVLRFNGMLYTADEYKNRILNQYRGSLNLYHKTVNETTDEYTGIGKDDIEYVNAYDGNVQIVLKTGEGTETEWYKKTGEGTYEKYTSLEEAQNLVKGLATKAECYKDGQMYYNIPIEHLADGKFSVNEDGTIKVNEGDYGVVRNHYYKITVNKIENLGNAVYDPNEEIIPNDNDLNKTYYLQSKINILSWKIVKQDVDL